MSKGLVSSILFGGACVVVGALAARGTFNSIYNFPWVFALVCLILGGLAVWRERSQGEVALRTAILVAGAAVAVAGWVYQGYALEKRLQTRASEVLAVFEGQAVPSLEGLEPLNTDPASWDQAASLTAPVTVVTFWARWCSPCRKEMEDLEVLYRRHRDRGLRVLAITSYDTPQDEEERRSDFAKAQAYLDKYGHTFPAAITDNREIYSAYQVSGPPAVVLVGEDGTVIDYAISVDDARELMATAEARLAIGARES